MSINPFSREGVFSIRDLQGEFDRLIDRFWHGGLSTPPLDGHDWAPPVDMTDEPGAFRMRVEVPGLTADQIDVSVAGRKLTIRGTKPNPRDKSDPRSAMRSECRYGSFGREIDLPADVQADAIRASCRNGVLELEIPKSAAARAQTVKITAAGD